VNAKLTLFDPLLLLFSNQGISRIIDFFHYLETLNEKMMKAE